MEDLDEFEEPDLISETSTEDNRCAYTSRTMTRHSRFRCSYHE